MSSVLEARPEVFQSLQWVWQGFWDLHFTRPVGLGIQPITFSEIKAYCELKRIVRRSDVDEFIALIRRMDAACLNWFSKKSEG